MQHAVKLGSTVRRAGSTGGGFEPQANNCQMASRAFAALALVASCAAAPLGRKWRSLPASAKQLYTYEDFNAEHGKTRSSTAQAVFEANLAEIHAHNARNESWTAGVNQFTDMTGEEFKSFYQGYVANMPTPIPSSPATPEILNAKLEDLADSVDWRTQKGPKGGPVLSAVKNQGGCGSCWAFSGESPGANPCLLFSPGRILIGWLVRVGSSHRVRRVRHRDRDRHHA